MASSATLGDGADITRGSRVAVDDLSTLLAFAAAVLLPFQNGMLSEFGLGSFGSSLSVVPVGLFGGLWLLRAAARPSSIVVSTPVLVALAYVAATTLFGLWYFEWQYRQASLVGKGLMAAAHWSFFLAGIAAGLACPRHLLRLAVRIAIPVNAVGLVLAPALGMVEGPSVSFSSEPSHYGVLAVCLGALGAYLAESRLERFLMLSVTLGLVLLMGSKGALACVGLAAIVVSMFRPPQHAGRRFMLYLGVVVFAATLMVLAIVRLKLDLEEFASVATRSSGAVTALQIGFDYPFGVGLAGFYPAFAEATPGSWRIITSLFGLSINLQETFSFAYTDDSNISAKTFFFDTLIYFGWPGLAAMLWFMGRLTLQWLRTRREASVWLAGGLVFALLAIGTYNTVIPLYVVPILFGFALRESSNL